MYDGQEVDHLKIVVKTTNTGNIGFFNKILTTFFLNISQTI